jgi:hypothetical protein
MRLAACLAALFIALPSGASDGCRAQSGATVRPLIELYTSEGCSSCPPADRWLSTRFSPGATHDAVPLAFHVDYWDRLGWKDRFASPRYTARQYQAMHANRATFVYTPQVVLQGRDFTGWRRGDASTALAAASRRNASVSIALSVAASGSAIDVDVAIALDASPKPSTMLALAYVDSGLASDVRAGENRGERLVHDHVVRAYETRDVVARETALRVRLARPPEAGSHAALVAFVQHASSGEVLQTLSLPLKGCMP